MLATPPKSVSDALLIVFSQQREMTADALHQALTTRFFPCSQRAVYKELDRLLKLGVLVKAKNYYSVSLTWILNLISFSEKLYSTVVESKPLVPILPREGEKVRWKFNDLQHMDRYWIQLMFLLFEHSTSRTMFVWVPHFWFDLVHYQKDLEAQEAMKISGNKMYMILGGRTFLDKLPTKYWSPEVYEWSYAVSPFENQRNRYFDMIDDYILSVTLDSLTTMRIGELFNKVRTAADLKYIAEFELIKSTARATLVLECSRLKAQRLRKKCCTFFGIPCL